MEVNRRVFIGAAGAAAALGQEKKLRLGLIGCGWWGGIDSTAALKAGGVEFTALCDIDSKNLEELSAAIEKQQGTRPRGFKHYKELLALGDLDGVFICTPPHWHALPFIAACERKLAVYEEKPLAYDIKEGRAMVNAWRKAANIVQVGFQRRQGVPYREVKQLVDSGGLGRIVQVDVNIHYTAQPLDNTAQEPPATLDWDLWCGPAPKLPYSPNVGHRAWRLEESVGNGHMVDWGIHPIDAARTMLSLGMPKSVTAVGGLYQYKGRITTPDTLTAHFEFERCPLVWRHRLWGAVEMTPEFSNGVTIFGEKATVFVGDNVWMLQPKGRGAQREVHEVKPPADLSMNHVKDWLDAVRAGRQPSCPPEEAFRSTATVQLGMISYKTGRTIEWDEKAERITNVAEANRLLMRPYRAPYRHPGA